MSDTGCAACAAQLTVSFFDNQLDTLPKRSKPTWGELKHRLQRFDLRAEKSGPAWSPVEYAAGALRENAGVADVYAAAMDVDDGTEPQAITKALTGYDYVIHSTHSSTPDKPRFRVVLPLAAPCPGSRWYEIFPRLATFVAPGHVDLSTKDPARIFFLPSARSEGKTFTYSGHGKALDLAELPAAETAAAAPPTSPARLDCEGSLPHGRHYAWLRSFTASFASRTPGATEAQLIEGTRAAFGTVADDLATHESEIIVLARTALAKYGRPAAKLDDEREGSLWSDVVAFYRAHYHFAEADDWAYTVLALLTFESWVADLLPAAFSAAMAGTIGKGKTRLGELVRELTRAEFASNVSPAALARTWVFGNLCIMDEADEGRTREQQDVLNALMRAYRPRNGIYKRIKNPKTGEVEAIDLYGPRLILGRSSAEAGIQSRCYDLPPGEPIDGDPGFAFVTRGMYPESQTLRPRLEQFSRVVHEQWSSDRIRAMVRGPGFPAKVRQIVSNLGANRESETGAIVSVVAEIVGVDVSEAMKKANEARKGAASTEGDELEMLMEAVLEALPSTQPLDDGGEVTVRQPAIRRAFNAICKREGTRAPGNAAFSKLRLDLGVGSGWTREWGGTLVWHVPAKVVHGWKAAVDASRTRPPSATPHSPHSPHPRHDENGGNGANGGNDGDRFHTMPALPGSASDPRRAARSAFDEAWWAEGGE